MNVNETFTRCVGVPAVYPLTTTYTAGVLTAVGVSTSRFDLSTGLVGLTLVTVLVFLATVRSDVADVKVLVNGQRTALLARIDRLVDYLIAAGVELPPGESEGEPHD